VIAAARRHNRNRNRRRILRVSPENLRRGESRLSSVLEFGQRGHGRWARPLGAAIAALLFHGAVGIIAGVKHAVSHEEPPPTPQQITVTLEKPPPPAPPPSTPQRPPVARSPKMVRPTPNKAPPAPAKTGKVVAAAPDPNDPVDMTGFNIAVGEGQSYAGGYSSAKGTSTQAIPNANARIGGKPNAVDQSRAAAPAHRDWSCPWPPEEQTGDLRDARVTIRVQIDSDGLPTSVDVLNAPPGGFAAAARRCAEGATYLAAHDSSGRPVASTTPPFVVHFFR
jgi:protein TonB